MKYLKPICLIFFLGLFSLVLVNQAEAATDFVSVIDPGNGAGADYTSLSAWEAAVQSDLTVATTKVFSWSTASGTIPDLGSVTGLFSGATASATHMTASTTDTGSAQILLTNINGTFQSGEQVYLTSTGASSTYAVLSDAGDSAIAVATCRTSNGSPDTTAVTINGWTTSATNYIKIWTDPDEPYRHRGVWDESGYRLEVITSSNYLIDNCETYVRFNGLQFKQKFDGSGNRTILQRGAAPVYISSCIFIANITSTNTGRAIDLWSGLGTAYIWNNIFYNYKNGSNSCYAIVSENNAYIYNNTIVNSYVGIYRYSGTLIAKNNLAHNNTTDYSGTFAASSTNNITNLNPEDGAFGASADSGNTDGIGSDTFKLRDTGQDFSTTVKVGMIVKNTTDTTYSYVTAVNSNTELTLNDDIMDDSENYTIYTNMFGNVTFENEEYDDFHLDSSDTVAKEKGADLSADANLPITDDIDGDVRTDALPGRLYDIGADENIAKIYRSVGPSATTALITGTTNYQTNHLTISGLYATFELPLPDNIGVGDAIQYDDDNDGDIDADDSLVFIDKRLSSQKYRVKTSSGGAPAETVAPDIDWLIYRAYISLSNAEAGTENTGLDDDLESFELFTDGRNIKTNQEQWNIACYANGTTADTASTSISGWTTATTSNLKIYTPNNPNEVGVSQRHEGKWDDSKYRLYVSDGVALYTATDFIDIEGLQIGGDGYTVSNRANVYINSQTAKNQVNLSHLIINRTVVNGVTGQGIYIYSNMLNVNVDIWNSIVIGSGNYNWSDFNACIYNGGETLNIYNSTLITSASCASGLSTDGGTVNAKNVYAKANSGNVYNGTITKTNCASSDTTGSAGLQNIAFSTANFMNVTTGSEDLRLTVGSALKNVGTDLISDLSYRKLMRDQMPVPGQIGGTDITSQGYSDDTVVTRPYNTAWDIGAHEVITKIYRSVAPDADGNMAAIDDDNSQADALSIATSGLATFEVAVADNVGVGDALIFDDDDDNDLDANDTLLFIHGRTDSTHYTVRTDTGDFPTASTTDNDKWAIYRAYTSLFNAEAGTKNTAIPISFTGGNRDLKANSEQWHIACYANTATNEADTTGTTISGWTTAPQNYFRVYTPVSTSEVGTSQRHQGKWDEGKYRMEVTNSNLIYDYIANSDFDGIQIKLISNISDIYLYRKLTEGDTKISNSIFMGEFSGNGTSRGVYTNSSGNYYFLNNVVYGISGVSYGYAFWLVSGRTYAYNNTVLGSNLGFFKTGGSAILKNNITQDCVNGYYGGFGPSSDYNISDLPNDAPSPSYRTNLATNVQLADSANKDFHLAQQDTGAKGYGADLSQDPIWQRFMAPPACVQTPCQGVSNGGQDIDGAKRPVAGSGNNWDIGADQTATPIYRSLAPSATTALDTGSADSNYLTISGSTLTVGTATPDNIGVGDVIQYDSNNDGAIDAVAFIISRASSSEYTVKSAVGGPPVPTLTPDLDWSIFRSYASLYNAERGDENSGLSNTIENFDDWTIGGTIDADDVGRDIWTNNEQWNIAAYTNGTTADTAAVTISGWTTAPMNYLKVYTPYAVTEVGTSQRHQGKWDDGKYVFYTSSGSGISVAEDYVIIDGLQVKFSASANAYRAIYLASSQSLTANEIKVSNNIVKGILSGTAESIGIGVATDNIVAKIYNNIVYDFITSSGGRGISARGNTYAYNNAVYNCRTGIYRSNGTIITKNNLSYNNIVDYSQTISASSTHNLSSDDTAPAYGTYYRNATVDFADAANKDFHLAASDTGARDKGADLSDDPIWQEMTRIDSINFPYGATSTDIDGHTRSTTTHSGAWDIGADEAATPVYFAVGQNTTDHKTGSPLITVDPDTRTATFTVAQTAANLGVGDEIDYDTDNKKCYITDKISTSVWKCRTATGSAPWAATDATVNAVKHAFASLNSAVNATLGTHAGDSSHLNATDLWTNNYQLNLPCYYDSGPDTTAVTVDGWTTGVPNYVKIYTPTDTVTEANARQRHWGKWDEGKYVLEENVVQGRSVLRIITNYVRVDGLQVKTGHIWQPGIGLAASDNGSSIFVSNNIVKDGNPGGNNTGIYISGNNSYVFNNIVYGFSSSDYAGIQVNSWNLSASNFNIYNNTVYGCYYNFRGYGRYNSSLKNNVFVSSTGGGDYSIGGDTSWINDNMTSANNLTSDNSSPNTGGSDCGGHSCLNQTVGFIDSINKDYHLSSTDTGARNAGADLSADANFAFDTDIDGSARNIDGQGWDIGADETATPVYYSVGQDGVTDRKVAATVDISSSTGLAAFSADQTGNIGVGDAVEYGTPTTTAYIASKQDQSHWYLITATGAFPDATTTATVHSIKRVFSSLSSAEATAPTLLGTSDLHANNYQLNLPCYYDTGPDQTAVTINGWTTAPQDYIKVYTPNNTSTEANVSQRHQGVWDEGKWRIEVTNNHVIKNLVSYFEVDGLQVKLNNISGSSCSSGIYFYPDIYPSRIQISNNIVLGNITGGSSWYLGIFGEYKYPISSLDVYKVFNNIVYSISTKKLDAGIYIRTGGSWYVYNNTSYNNAIGIFAGIPGSGYTVTKNNLAYSNTSDYSGIFFTSSTNNLSSDATAPAYGTYYRNATVNFVDPTNNDFRLLPTDTGAKDKGIEETDSSIDLESLQSDIAGNERYDGYWDIGAFEAPTILYRSVGNDQSNLAGDGNTVTIASSTAVFANALPANVGVGDVIQYGQSGAYQLAFITGRSSSTEYAVQARTGALPSATSTAPAQVFRAHEFLDDWEDQVVADVNDGIDDSVDDLVLIPNLDLAASNTAMFVPCYASTSPDNLSTTIDGWTTATTSYVKVYTPVSVSEVGESQRHAGKWDEGKYRIDIVGNGLISYAPYTDISGLQIKITGGNSQQGIEVNEYSNVIYDNIIYGILDDDSQWNSGIGVYTNNSVIFNNIIYNFISANTVQNNGIYANGYPQVYIYNNTIYNSDRGIVNNTGGGGSGYFVLKNNLVQNCDVDYSGGNFSASSTHNLSSDNTAPAFGIYYRDAVVNFIDPDNADFHLLFTDASAKNAGLRLTDDPYLSFSTDIDGETRSTDKWDIGADEAHDARVKFRGTNFRIQGKVRIE